MDENAFESLEAALAPHKEWEASNIKLSVHESHELDELVDVDLAQCLGKANGSYFRHNNLIPLSHQVRNFRFRLFNDLLFSCFDISSFDISSFDISLFDIYLFIL